MFYFYIVLSAALIPILNIFFNILRQPYSWWLVPVILIVSFFVLCGLQFLVLFISVICTSLNSPAGRGTKYFRIMVNLSIPLLFKLMRVKIHVKGLEKLPENDRMLFICNHQHDLDPLLMMAIFPDADLGFIGKKEIYETRPVAAKIMHKLYCLPIDRENDRAAVKTIIEAIKILKDKKASIGLFPEGYTSKTRELLPFRNGSFKIAYKAESPIVVCVLDNSYSIIKNLFKRHTDIEFHIIEVLNPEDYKTKTTTELGEYLHSEMEAELEEIRK